MGCCQSNQSVEEPNQKNRSDNKNIGNIGKKRKREKKTNARKNNKIAREKVVKREKPNIQIKEQYTKLLHKNSNEYKIIKKMAFLENKRREKERNGKEWSKQTLTVCERMYLFHCCRGRCANKYCKKTLDKGYAVEHIMPKSRHPSEMWKMQNFTILCTSCNSAKKDRHVYDVKRKFQYDMRVSMKAKKQDDWIAKGTPKKRPRKCKR